MPRRAFTLIEILIVVVIIAMVGALAIPYFSRDHRDRSLAAASLLQADLRFAQLATMASPQDPLIVRFKEDGTGYWLARLSAPNDPIVRPDTGAVWNITMGVDRARRSRNVSLATSGINSGMLRFTPLGSVHGASGTPTITLSAAGGGSGGTCVVTVDPTTGDTAVSFP